MGDDFRKPLYADYKKHMKKHRRGEPIISREREYRLVDRPLVVIGNMLILAAAFAMTLYAPGAFSMYSAILLSLYFAVFEYSLSRLYARFIVYRFGVFRVKWEHPEEHPGESASDNCDAAGNLLKNEQNHDAAVRSRFASLCFLGALVASVLLLYYVGFGLSHTRVFSRHKTELEEAAHIAQKYDWVQAHPGIFDLHAYGWTKDDERISEQDEKELEQILGSLQWDYVLALDAPPSEEAGARRFVVTQGAGLSISYIVRYYDTADATQVKKDYPDMTVTQLDEHWWYVR